QVRASAVKVDNHHGARKPPPSGSLLQHRGYQVWIHVPACTLAVDKDRLSSKVTDWIRACDERERRCDHLVAGPDAQKSQAEVDGGGPAAERDRRQAHQAGHFPLELVEVRSDGRELVAGKRPPDEGFFLGSHMRDGKVDALHRGLPGPALTFALRGCGKE